MGFERARSPRCSAHAESRLAECDDAIDRLPSGSYGRCEVCSGHPPSGWAALPSARTCVACAASGGGAAGPAPVARGQLDPVAPAHHRMDHQAGATGKGAASASRTDTVAPGGVTSSTG